MFTKAELLFLAQVVYWSRICQQQVLLEKRKETSIGGRSFGKVVGWVNAEKRQGLKVDGIKLYLEGE